MMFFIVIPRVIWTRAFVGLGGFWVFYQYSAGADGRNLGVVLLLLLIAAAAVAALAPVLWLAARRLLSTIPILCLVSAMSAFNPFIACRLPVDLQQRTKKRKHCIIVKQA